MKAEAKKRGKCFQLHRTTVLSTRQCPRVTEYASEAPNQHVPFVRPLQKRFARACLLRSMLLGVRRIPQLYFAIESALNWKVSFRSLPLFEFAGELPGRAFAAARDKLCSQGGCVLVKSPFTDI